MGKKIRVFHLFFFNFPPFFPFPSLFPSTFFPQLISFPNILILSPGGGEGGGTLYPWLELVMLPWEVAWYLHLKTGITDEDNFVMRVCVVNLSRQTWQLYVMLSWEVAWSTNSSTLLYILPQPVKVFIYLWKKPSGFYNWKLHTNTKLMQLSCLYGLQANIKSAPRSNMGVES